MAKKKKLPLYYDEELLHDDPIEESLPTLESLVEYNNDIAMNPDIFAFDSEMFGDPEHACKEFCDANKEIANQKTTDIQTVKNFIRHIYKGGDSDVTLKDFIDYLVDNGYTVKDRRENRFSKLERM